MKKLIIISLSMFALCACKKKFLDVINILGDGKPAMHAKYIHNHYHKDKNASVNAD
jgi:hypothetical protein